MFTAQIRDMFMQAGTIHNLEPAVLAAIAHIESGSIITTVVDGRNEPQIRFEGHYFDRRLSPPDQIKARELKLASPRAGTIPNPAKQNERWKMLKRAAAINSEAAYESTSWGIGQVMGAHWHWLGYPSVTALVETVRASVQGQIELMARFLVYSNLRSTLNAHDWRKLAYHYNGPLYAKNKYDLKLPQAYATYQPLFPVFQTDCASTG